MSSTRLQHSISLLFLVAYLLLVISTIQAFRPEESQSEYLLIARGLLYALIVIAWIAQTITSFKRFSGVVILMLALSPYLLTRAYMVAVDTAMIFIVASGINHRLENGRRYFVRAAYVSAFVVTLVAILAELRVLPTTEFEWGGRIKEAVGFLNPNTFYYYLFSSSFISFLLYDTTGFVLFGVIMAVFYPIVESRTFFFAYLLLAAYWLFSGFIGHSLRNTAIWIGLAVAITFGVLSGLFPLETSGALALLFGIDPSEFLSNRLEIIETGSDSSLLTLLGGNPNFADSLYVYLISGVGVPLAIAALAIVLSVLIRYSTREWDGRILMAGFIYFTVGCFEVPYGGSSLIAVFFAWMLFFSKPTSPEPLDTKLLHSRTDTPQPATS